MPGGYHLRLEVSKSTQTPSTPSSYQRSHLDSNTFIPSSIFQSLPAHQAKPTGRRYSFFLPRDQARLSEAAPPGEPSAYKDYRFGPLRVDWVDFDDMNLNGLTRSGPKNDRSRNP
ncbi:uncharacterized protein PHACADRAFT_263734, partial [Phanerochaete carnosa HHB-10118-sp]